MQHFLKFIFFRYTSDHRMCCYFDHLQECTTIEEQPLLFNCGSMMQNTLLRISMWLLALSALFGNLLVFIWRLQAETRSDIQTVQAIFTANLAFSDLLMGFYMLFLAIADVYYGNEFHKFSDFWRESIPCRVASFLTLLSGETSLFLLTLITIDRFLCLVFPFSTTHFKKKSALMSVFGIWCITIPLSLLASVFASADSDFYQLSDVCIGLPLVTRPARYEVKSTKVGEANNERTFEIPTPSGFKNSWYFSLVVFLGINLILTCLITVLYIIIFFAVRKSRRAVQKSPSIKQEIVMAVRMTVIALTNCVCWMPVVIIGIMSQTEFISVSLDMYIWSVVFILPVNASLNPYLYTVSVLLSK